VQPNDAVLRVLSCFQRDMWQQLAHD